MAELGLKLFFLAVRQVSKPIAAATKRAAQESPTASVMLVSVGRAMHRISVQYTRLTQGKERLATIAQIKEEKALAQGAEMLSESVIYAVGGITLSYDWLRSRREKDAKAAKERDTELKRRAEVAKEQEKQRDMVRHLEKRITLMQEELLDLRKQQLQQQPPPPPAQEPPSRRGGWLGLWQ